MPPGAIESGCPIIVIPSEAVQSAAKHREVEESILRRRAATPLLLLRHDVGCLVVKA